MEDITIDLGDIINVSGDASLSVDDDFNLITESETLVGPPGPPGPQGETGAPGQDGAAATITVGSTTTGQPGTNATVVNVGTENAAVLNFTIPRGERGLQGIQGESGEDGQDGADGTAATVTVGSVQTTSSDYPAQVTNSGTSSAAILNFVIPRGYTGPAGQDGADGADGTSATITVGSTTTGNPGTNASVINSGTSSAAVLDFTIPRGADGADGQDGADGTSATITVGSTTTGNPGTNASVTNSGTSSAAVLDFTIPRGADGTNGQDGADGYSPTATVLQVGGLTVIEITDKNGTTTATITVPTQLSDLSGTISTSQIANSAVTSTKLSGMPGPDFSTILNNWGTISSTTTKSITADGFICGKAIISGVDSAAYITINSNHVAGFPYNGSSSINNLQASFCFPVKKGMSVVFSTGSGGQFQAVKQVGWTM